MSPSLPSLALCAPLIVALAAASKPARIPERHRVRLAEAIAVIEAVQDKAWPGWSRAPSTLVLVDRDFEYLLRSGEQPEGFVDSGNDPRLGGRILARRRTFSPALLATFPAFGPTPTIVVGTAERTGKSSTAWVLAVAHEHFHQLQYSDPGYWRESEALGLAGDDRTGLWMLDYPFPYASTSTAFASLSRELARLVGGPAPAAPDQREAFWRRYTELCRRMKPEDYRYLSFQLWQEGIARYVETRLAEIASREHRVSAEFAALRDYRDFAAAAAALRDETLHELRTQTMATDGRTVFYAFGAGLGLLLDQEGQGWRERYLPEKFCLERYRAPRPRPAVPVPGPGTRRGRAPTPSSLGATRSRLPARANYGDSGHGDTVPVGRYAPDALGLHDMAGNVWELALDEWLERYPEGPQRDPVAGGPVSDAALLAVTGRRALRGGSFGGAPVNLRSRWRDSHVVTKPVGFVGFRCVYPPPPTGLTRAAAP